ncbi:type IV toxin-antitoxin system AbiEi family antitoxin domain-containing protein [Corynebacterium camporealensis]|uniref:type IV toxin-antitoxin system AbiEi family antitoxin domain-containing protein n=1 Tax=Corynebacterium camporealensis TaxID=161896 RepID=UPI0034CEC1B8
MKIVEATEMVLSLASQQWGMVTTAQAKSAGVTSLMLGRLQDKAILHRVRSGVYISTAVGWSAATEIRAQWLALEPKTMAADRLTEIPSAVVSHESAAELHGIGDLETPRIRFTVPNRRQTRQPDVAFRPAQLTADDWMLIDSLPVTTPVRTLIDLARAGHEPDHLSDVVRDILHLRLATRAELSDVIIDF